MNNSITVTSYQFSTSAVPVRYSPLTNWAECLFLPAGTGDERHLKARAATWLGPIGYSPATSLLSCCCVTCVLCVRPHRLIWMRLDTQCRATGRGPDLVTNYETSWPVSHTEDLTRDRNNSWENCCVGIFCTLQQSPADKKVSKDFW